MDSAFKTAPYPAYTIPELQAFIAEGRPNADVMAAEIVRRQKVEAGDVSVMMPGERLRFAKKKPAEDLTPEGIQLVIPGAERVQAPSKKQMELF